MMILAVQAYLGVGATDFPLLAVRLSGPTATSIWAHCLIDIITFAAAMPLLATRIRLIACVSREEVDWNVGNFPSKDTLLIAPSTRPKWIDEYQPEKKKKTTTNSPGNDHISHQSRHGVGDDVLFPKAEMFVIVPCKGNMSVAYPTWGEGNKNPSSTPKSANWCIGYSPKN